MYEIRDFKNEPLKRESAALKVRLANTFRLSGQKIADLMAEIKTLSAETLEWFRQEYERAGYPCTSDAA